MARAAEEIDIKIALAVAVRMGNIGCNPEMWYRLLDAVPFDLIGLSWAKVTGALMESGYDYVLCVNEDRGMPGLEGFAYGCRHLRRILPSREGHEAPSAPWLIRQ